ncbi:uncharacterized protein At2g34160-like [Magnolia sinica]|uniref:uncharacterized protein At2g34160-like n=1 Tax=Magnolia sinica TaxID=86752 RepID=UPI00265B2C07|nr:uncharacterized protein At2g34160-like [Magnolia sinica]
MEAVAEASANLVTESQSLTKKRIQVSNAKKPLHFYVFLAKRYMKQHNEIEIELSALGMAIATAITVAEILKRSGFAIQKSKQSTLFKTVAFSTVIFMN